MNRLGRVVQLSTPLAHRAGVCRATPVLRVIASNAALEPQEQIAKLPTLSHGINWDKILAQSENNGTLRKLIEEIKNDHTIDLKIVEKPASAADAEAPKAARHFEWDLLSEIVTSEEGKKQLRDLRAGVREIQDWIAATTEKHTEPIDWKHFHQELDPFVPGFVDLSKKALEDIHASATEIDLSAQFAQLEAQSKVVTSVLESFAQSAEEISREIHQDLEAFKSERSIADMSTEEVLALYPQFIHEIESEIAEGNWNP
eukprot:c4127_g1_i1.p1 GENE.c4127_g1_i1~~c4127_g1_i1.p1  ORF type:complete len:258 (+),score=69.36 c4127_g1_i1:44-817(+)